MAILICSYNKLNGGLREKKLGQYRLAVQLKAMGIELKNE
jgi:hypothetical protein